MNLELMKAQRKTSGFSQAEVARQLDITQQTYARYETGERQPSPDMLLKLSNALGLTLDDLLRPSNSETSTPKEEPLMTTNENWAEIIKNLTDTLKLEAENTRLRIEKVEAKEAEARLISEQRQKVAEHNLTLALEESRAARLAQAFSHPDDRPDEAAAAEE